ncbi:MAG TPA: hypothetical protein VF933_34835 [Streptosporangiaceae bacterium]
MHGMIPLADPYGWNNGGAVMTLVLPLGFFIVVSIALYFVFTRPHTVPGRRPITGARPVAPDPQAARDMSAAVGFGTASSGGGTAPLADRGTPPVAGARSEDNTASDDSAGDTAAGDTAAGDAGSTEGSEDQE